MELFNKLTSKHKTFEKTWRSFMFNLEELKMLKKLKADLISKVLSAGLRYLGLGWSPERARERLLELSGRSLREPKFASYLHIRLLTIAL